MTDLHKLQQGWEQAAQQDPMSYILSDPQPPGGWTTAEFFATGADEITAVVRRLDDLGLRRGSRVTALDFGCGIGRLTQALARYYDRCVGVDISEAMIRQARQLNQMGERCAYLVNRTDDLSQFGSGAVDLVYSGQVLMHMPSSLGERYVREFLRVLAPRGLAVFQVPEGPQVIAAEHEHWMDIHCTARGAVEDWVSRAGGRAVDVEVLGPERVGDVASEPFRCLQYTALAPTA